jgi:dTDP-glucose 4,6-dehydratase
MSILVTGSTGFLGKSLIRHLGHARDVLVLGSAEARKDITQMDSIVSEFSDVETVFHLAAILNYRNSPDTLMRLVNVTGTRNVLEASVKAGVNNFVYVSSQEVYGEPLNLPVNENDDLKPNTTYGKTKLDAEELCRYYAGEYGIRIAIARPAVIYGPSMPSGSLVSNYIEEALENGKIEIYGRGSRIYDCVFVDDVAGVLTVMEGKEGVFNIGGGLPYNSKEIAETISDIIPCEVSYNAGMQEKRGYYIDTGKAGKELNFCPLDLRAGLKKTIEHYRTL